MFQDREGLTQRASHVFAAENRAIEPVDLRVYPKYARNKVVQILINRPIHSYLLSDPAFSNVMKNKFRSYWHIYAMNIKKFCGSRSRGKVDFCCTRISCCLNYSKIMAETHLSEAHFLFGDVIDRFIMSLSRQHPALNIG